MTFFPTPRVEQASIEELSRRLMDLTEQLTENNRKLKRLQQEREEMLSNLSHDLRAPLTAIRSAIDLLRSGEALSPEDTERALRLIDRRTGTLEHLIRDMYELFCVEDISRPLQVQELDAAPFLEEYFYTVLPQPRYAAHPLTLEVPQELHCLLRIEPLRIVRLLDNLFSNAAKYTPEQTALSLRAVPLPGSGLLRICVVDHGPGIPPREREAVFRRTYTGSSARTPSASGSGLGLAIARAIAERHNGTLTCEETSGGGCTFVLTLPAKFYS